LADQDREPTYKALWPLARIDVAQTGQVRGLPDLAGKVVAELWDYIFRGDLAFSILREQLARRYPGISFISYAEFGNINGPHQRDILARLPEQLRARGCDAVIAGVGA
jgi:hypothetical protein